MQLKQRLKKNFLAQPNELEQHLLYRVACDIASSGKKAASHPALLCSGVLFDGHWQGQHVRANETDEGPIDYHCRAEHISKKTLLISVMSAPSRACFRFQLDAGCEEVGFVI